MLSLVYRTVYTVSFCCCKSRPLSLVYSRPCPRPSWSSSSRSGCPASSPFISRTKSRSLRWELFCVKHGVLRNLFYKNIFFLRWELFCVKHGVLRNLYYKNIYFVFTLTNLYLQASSSESLMLRTARCYDSGLDAVVFSNNVPYNQQVRGNFISFITWRITNR